MKPDNGSGLLVDRPLQLPLFGDCGVANLHQFDPDLPYSVVVPVALGLMDDNLVLETGQVRQSFDGGHVVSGDAGGDGNDNAAGRARTDVAGLVLCEEGDTVADTALQLGQFDKDFGGLHH